jgi:hypothetical protein
MEDYSNAEKLESKENEKEHGLVLRDVPRCRKL